MMLSIFNMLSSVPGEIVEEVRPHENTRGLTPTAQEIAIFLRLADSVLGRVNSNTPSLYVALV